MVKVETANWRRISKAKARQAYLRGDDPIRVVPCKVDPDNVWGIGTDIVLDDESQGRSKERWETFLNHYIWDNCQHNELGKYPAFYERVHND